MYHISVLLSFLFLMWFQLVPNLKKIDYENKSTLEPYGVTPFRLLLTCLSSYLFIVNVFVVFCCLLVLNEFIKEFGFNKVYNNRGFFIYNRIQIRKTIRKYVPR